VRKIRKLRPSPAMGVAFLALFIALAGSATAAKLIGGNQIKNNSVTAKDVKDGSLLRKDFKKGQLPAGAQGPQGPQGVAGPAGRAGRDGFGQIVYSQGVGDPIPNGDPGEDVFAICPIGTFPTGGDAFYVTSDTGDLVAAQPIQVQGIATDLEGVPVGWVATPTPNAEVEDIELIVDAACVNANQVGFASTPQAKAKASAGGLARPDRFKRERP
jgi:hypothetical protein